MTVFTKINGLVLPGKNKAGFILQNIVDAQLLSMNFDLWTTDQRASVIAITQQNIYDTAYLLTSMAEVQSMLNGSSNVIMLHVPNAQQIINL